MSQESFQSILEALNATSGDICASVLMTKDGLALASASPAAGYDEDRLSALSASILRLGHKFLDDFFGGELDQVTVEGKKGKMLAIRHGHELALTVLARPDAEPGPIFSQMRRLAGGLEGACLGI